MFWLGTMDNHGQTWMNAELCRVRVVLLALDKLRALRQSYSYGGAGLVSVPGRAAGIFYRLLGPAVQSLGRGFGNLAIRFP